MTKERMIQLLLDDLSNEWTHLSYYLHHAGTVQGLHREEYHELLTKEAAGEMTHVGEFQSLIAGLQVKWGMPVNLNVTAKAHPVNQTQPKDILAGALTLEDHVVGNYAQRIEDALELAGTDGHWIEIFMEGQLENSRIDADNLRQILAE